jgi:hypothetical protein
VESGKIVARFKDGSILKGTTRDFVPDEQILNIKVINGGIEKIDITELKAIFFVKDLKGDESHKKQYKDVDLWGGQKVKVEFTDGEIILGYSSNLSTGKYGFFITPADNKGNNEQIFVIKSATKSIAFL